MGNKLNLNMKTTAFSIALLQLLAYEGHTLTLKALLERDEEEEIELAGDGFINLEDFGEVPIYIELGGEGGSGKGSDEGSDEKSGSEEGSDEKSGSEEGSEEEESSKRSGSGSEEEDDSEGSKGSG